MALPARRASAGLLWYRVTRRRGNWCAAPYDRCVEFERLARDAGELWEAFAARRGGAFSHLVPSDYGAVRAALTEVAPDAGGARRGRPRFLELGSGVGAIAILADLLGFEAWGIEIDGELVGLAEELAARFDSGARFVEGSFVPDEYRDEVELLDTGFFTHVDGNAAYDELGHELDDFDVVYAFPWPEEEEWMNELLRRFTRPDAVRLTWSASDGVRRV